MDKETTARHKVRGCASVKKGTNQEHISVKVILFLYEMHMKE